MLKEKLCVVVADEHDLSRDAICLLLGRMLPRAMVLAIAPGQQEVPFAPCPDCLVLFGMRPPYLKSLNTLSRLRVRFPRTPLVLLTEGLDAKVVQMARARGADGLFHTSGSAEDLLAVMKRTLEGKPCFPPAPPGETQRADYRFTPRQIEVLDLLCQGKSNKEIGAALNLSDNTVRTHVAAIFSVLGARNRTEAVVSGRYLI
jgi:two-component system nitrate/nitrite response regulator NarL